MKKVDVAIIGAGSGGLSAYQAVKQVTKNLVVINSGPHGTTCARVGCMPSKVLLQVANDFYRRKTFELEGIQGADQLLVDVPHAMKFVRSLRDRFVRGVLGTVDEIGDRNIDARATLVNAHTLKVENEVIEAKAIVLATGSRPMFMKEWSGLEDHILTSDTIFEQKDLPPRVAVFGTGYIGLELGQAMSRLGKEVTIFGRSGRVAGLTDPEINAYAQKAFAKELPLFFAQDFQFEKTSSGIRISWGTQSVEVDAILSAIGRKPNVDGIGLENCGIELDDNGIPLYDRETMQIGRTSMFIAGDVNNDLPILHEASDEGRIAGRNAALGETKPFLRRTPLSIGFTDPQCATAGKMWKEIPANTFETGSVTFEGQGRSIVMSKEKGLLHIYGDRQTGLLLGAELMAPSGEHLAHLLSWAIQQRLTVFEALALPFYHPVVEEGLRTALRDLAKRVDPERARFELLPK